MRLPSPDRTVASIRRCCGVLMLLGMLFVLDSCAHRSARYPWDNRRITESDLAEQAESYFRQGELSPAMAAYTAYLTKFPQGRQADKAMRRLGDIYFRQHQYEAAQAFYQKLIKQFPYSAHADEVRLALVDLLNETGRSTEALQLARQMAEGKLAQNVRRQLWRRLEQLCRDAGEYLKAARYAYSVMALVGDPEKKIWMDRLMENLRHLQSGDLKVLGDTITDELLHGFLTWREAELALEAGETGDALDLLSGFQNRFADHPLAAEATRLVGSVAQELHFEPFTIGCLLPLSGPYREYGRSALNGIELAVSRQQDSASPPPIRLLVKDSEIAGDGDVAAIKELVNAGAGAIIGPMTDVETAAREAQKQSIPMITLTQKQDITKVGGYIFRNFITPQNQVERLADYLTGSMGLRSFAVLYPLETYGETFKELFREAIARRGGQIAALQAYDPGQIDFTDTIEKLLQAGREYVRQADWQNEQVALSPTAQENHQMSSLQDEGVVPETPETEGVGFEALFIPDSTQKAALILPQLEYSAVRELTLAGTNLWHSEKILSVSRPFDGRIIVVDGFFKESRLPATYRFVEEYRTIFSEEPGLIEALAFDSANFLFEVMSSPEIQLRAGLRSSMQQHRLRDGASGTLFFDESGEAQKRLFLLRVVAGRFVEVDDL